MLYNFFQKLTLYKNKNYLFCSTKFFLNKANTLILRDKTAKSVM